MLPRLMETLWKLILTSLIGRLPQCRVSPMAIIPDLKLIVFVGRASSPLTPAPPDTSPMRPGEKHAASPPSDQPAQKRPANRLQNVSRDESHAGPSQQTDEDDDPFGPGSSRTPRTMSQVLKAQAPTAVGDTKKKGGRGRGRGRGHPQK